MRVREASEEANQDRGTGKGEGRVLFAGAGVDHRHGAHMVKADIAHGEGEGALAARSGGRAITDVEHLVELECTGGGDRAAGGVSVEGGGNVRCKAGPDVAEKGALQQPVGRCGVKGIRLPKVSVDLMGIQRSGDDGRHVAMVQPHGEEEATPEVHARATKKWIEVVPGLGGGMSEGGEDVFGDDGKARGGQVREGGLKRGRGAILGPWRGRDMTWRNGCGRE